MTPDDLVVAPSEIDRAARRLRMARRKRPENDSAPILLDVSRLIWRSWAGRMPTGIDRVCLAYVDHFDGRAHAVIQRRGVYVTLSIENSQRLFALFRSMGLVSRATLTRILAGAFISAWRSRPQPGSFYLNVGHTGLDDPALPIWVARKRLRAVYMVHDLIPLTHPQYCRSGEAIKHQKRIRNVLMSAAGIIGNSQATIDEVVEFAHEHALQVPPSVVAWISGRPPITEIEIAKAETPHFVVLGTVEGRKNLTLLLDIWSTLVSDFGSSAPTLVVIGQRGWQAEDVLRRLDRPEDFEGRVHYLEHCSDIELASWIRGARAILMPSHAEGFGLPLTEALELGVPVIANDLTVFREIGGDIPTFIDASDEYAWKDAICSFTQNLCERRRQLHSIASYTSPTWHSHFAIVDPWLRSLAEQ